MNPLLIALFVGSYLVGAIPFGVLIARSKGIDILKEGSGNPGATNVKRVLGAKAGYTVFALDVLKGMVPALAARSVVREPVAGVDPQLVWMLVGFAAVLGHCLSPFLGFKGGKGIATSLGAGVAATPLVALTGFAVFFVVLALTHYVSLASMVAIASTIGWLFVYPGQSPQLFWPLLALTLLTIYRHRPNIVRLANGTESKTYLREPKMGNDEVLMESASPDPEPHRQQESDNQIDPEEPDGRP